MTVIGLLGGFPPLRWWVSDGVPARLAQRCAMQALGRPQGVPVATTGKVRQVYTPGLCLLTDAEGLLLASPSIPADNRPVPTLRQLRVPFPLLKLPRQNQGFLYVEVIAFTSSQRFPMPIEQVDRSPRHTARIQQKQWRATHLSTDRALLQVMEPLSLVREAEGIAASLGISKAAYVAAALSLAAEHQDSILIRVRILARVHGLRFRTTGSRSEYTPGSPAHDEQGTP